MVNLYKYLDNIQSTFYICMCADYNRCNVCMLVRSYTPSGSCFRPSVFIALLIQSDYIRFFRLQLECNLYTYN